MFKVIRIDLSGVLFKIFWFLVIYKCTGMYNGRFRIKESLGKLLLFELMHLEGTRFFQLWHYGHSGGDFRLVIKEG